MSYYSSGSGLIELEIPFELAEIGYHQGQCDDDVNYLSGTKPIWNQLKQIDPQVLRDELDEYGAWDDDELSDHSQNLQRLLWLACGDIIDNVEE